MQCNSPSVSTETRFLEVAVTAFVQAVSRATRTETEIDIFTIVAQFCGVALAVYFIWASYGLDLSPGFF